MCRFFVPQECIKENLAFIAGKEAHHILDVLRLNKGAPIQFFDGSGKFYQGKILSTQAKLVKVHIESIEEMPQAKELEITLVQSLPKKGKMDEIIEKCTELGIDVIIPTQTARSIVRLDKDKELKRQRRWQEIALQTAKQSARATVPTVRSLSPWTDILASLGDYDLKLIACLHKNSQRLKDVLQLKDKVKKIIFFIGPEGDFTAEEVSQAYTKGALSVSLGENVLKSDTAAIALLAILNYELRQ